MTSLTLAFSKGKRFAFDTMLCPAKKVLNPQGNSRRVFLASAEERELWLKRKATQCGFTIEWVREEGQRKEYGAHGEIKGGGMYHTGVRFKGILVVSDSEAFADAFSNGIGSGKAYGFGMLLLYRAS